MKEDCWLYETRKPNRVLHPAVDDRGLLMIWNKEAEQSSTSSWLPCLISSAVLCHPLLDVELYLASLFHIISSPLSSVARCGTVFGFLVSYHQQSSVIHCWMWNSIWLPCFISSAVLCHPLLDVELYLASLFHIISSPLSSVARCGSLISFLVSYHQQSSVIRC